MQKFFLEVWQTPNQLLKAVLADIKIPEHLAGCKALGLVNKFITGPLWRVLDSKDITILEMNERFQTLLSYLNKWSLDASCVLSGDALLYDDFPPSEDQIYSCLMAPSEHDHVAQEILQVLCSAFSSLLLHLVKDHLSGGEYDNPSKDLEEQTKSVSKTNTISERDFAMLDRLIREKPNAITLSLEAVILFSNNKTAQWLHKKSISEREELLQKARTCAPEFRKLYRTRKQHLLEERAKILQSKQRALLRLQEKALELKEKLTNDLMLYGLWQSETDIQNGLAKLKTKTEQLKALKTQLLFRSKVLEQKHPEKDVFFLSKNKKKLSVDEVVQNLKKTVITANLY